MGTKQGGLRYRVVLLLAVALCSACSTDARNEPRTLKDRTATACGAMVAVWDGEGQNQVQLAFEAGIDTLVDGMEFELPDEAWTVRHVQGTGLNQCPQAVGVPLVVGSPTWATVSDEVVESTGSIRVEIQDEQPGYDLVLIGMSVYPSVGEPIEFGNQAYTDLLLRDAS